LGSHFDFPLPWPSAAFKNPVSAFGSHGSASTDTGTTGTAQSTNAHTSFVRTPTTLGSVTDVFGRFSISIVVLIITSSEGDLDADGKSALRPDQGKGKAETRHYVDNFDAKLDEEQSEVIGMGLHHRESRRKASPG
jgi:hypothetical protein